MDIPLKDYIIKLAREKGFKEFTTPQIEAIPHILNRRNVVVVAPTGSGKTEAAFLPILQMMYEERGEPIQTIYITPLRALNRDLIDRLIWWASKLDLSISIRHGDTPQRERRRQAEAPPDILITTPETFSFLINTKRMGRYIRNTRWIIVDEVHELISSKRGVQLSINLERLRDENPGIQVIGLSATVGEPEKVLRFIAGDGDGVIIAPKMVKKFEIKLVYPSPADEDYDYIDKLLTYPDVIARIRVIDSLIKRHRATLVFTNTRPMAEILGSRLLLYSDENPIAVHHGSLGRNIRIRIEEMFKTRRLKGIICTSSLELGIDIGDIDLVIQYGSPRQASKLIQRVGRSGHWIGRVSKGVIIVQDPDDALESMVIRNRALGNNLEDIKILHKPLDVLMHEIAGILISMPRFKLDNLVSILRRSIYYKDISEDEVRELVRFIRESSGWIGYSSTSNIIFRGESYRRLYGYYFENLSMIPETRQYYVVNDDENMVIGVLDDEFISLYGEIGVKFIMAGRVWKISQIYKDKVFVKPIEDPFGAVPDWIGEEIPVPYEVASEVGYIKRRFMEGVKQGGLDKALDILANEYDVDREYLERALKPYYEDIRRGRDIPTDKNIVIEYLGNRIIMYVHGGTLVNRTIASFIAYILSRRYGEKVRYASDQYRIFIETSGLDPYIIKIVLSDTDAFKRSYREFISRSNVFKWRFLHVAKRMGIVSKDKHVSKSELDDLIRILIYTPVYNEALNETIIRDYDIENSLRIMDEVSRGGISVIVREGFSNVTEEYLRYHEPKYDILETARRETLEIISFKARVLNKNITLACLDCMNYVEETRVRDLEDNIKCPICGSSRIGVSELLYGDMVNLIERAKANPDSLKRDREWRKIVSSAKLVSKYGKTAVFVIFSDGLSYKDMEEILSIEDRITDKLVRLVITRIRENLRRKVLQSKR